MANQSKFARPKEPNAAEQQQAIQHLMQLIHQHMQLKEVDANARILSRGTVKQVKQLLDKGFDVNKPMGLPECWFTPLAMALINKHKRVARLLIERGADVNAQAYSMLYVPTGDISHLTALSFAIIGGFEDKAKVLVKCGADVNAVTFTVIRRNGTYIHQKPLGFALTQGKLTLARYLIANGASMRAPCIEYTEETGKVVCSALFLNPGFCLQNGAQITEVTEFQRGGFVYTCTMMGLGLRHNNKEIVQHLLQNGVDVNESAITIVSDKTTLTFPPLAWAMLARLHTIIPLLHGADNKMLITTDPIGFSIPPLALALMTGSNEAILELMQLGVNVDEGVTFRENEMEVSITTLGWAIFNEQTLIAYLLLLMNGADPNESFIDYKGNDDGIVFLTPLMMALMSCNSILTAALFEFGAKANTTGMTIQYNDSKEGMVSISLPHLFGTAESAEFAKVLLEHGCDIDAPLEIRIEDKVWPITPLALAASTDRTDIVEFLLENGANVDHQDAFIGLSALVCATFAGQQQNMELLLKHKADVNQVGRVTALTAACIVANSEAARLLLEHGANVDLTDSQGKSPLISAVQTTNDKGGGLKKKDVKGTVELLFEYKAEVDLRRALELAREEGLTEIAALIAEHTGTSDTPPQAENIPSRTEAGANTELIMQFMRIVTKVQDTLCNFESTVCSRFDKFEDKLTTMTKAVDLLTSRQGVLQPQKEPEVTSPQASISASSTQQEDSKLPKLAEAHRILKQLAHEWENIGMYLEIPDHEIKAIKIEERGVLRNCLRELLIVWLRRVAPPPSWRALAEAVGEVDERVAREITDRHTR